MKEKSLSIHLAYLLIGGTALFKQSLRKRWYWLLSVSDRAPWKRGGRLDSAANINNSIYPLQCDPHHQPVPSECTQPATAFQELFRMSEDTDIFDCS